MILPPARCISSIVLIAYKWSIPLNIIVNSIFLALAQGASNGRVHVVSHMLWTIQRLGNLIYGATHWIKPNLIHNRDTCRLGLSIERHHGRRHIASRYNVLLVADCRLDHRHVECVRNQADDQLVLGHCCVQCIFLGHVE